MTYQQTIDYLYSSTPMFHKQGTAAYKEGLENTLALDKYFGHPHENYKTIHVAGTNGKGSTSSMLAAYLQTLGYKVGLYTSPHIHSFRERIRVNGEMIPEQEVVDFVENHKSFFEPLQPSFFEITTALAFHYFAKAEVEIAVVEVGLGGMLDCTNIIRPVLSVITNIAHDHTNLLGETLHEIATQKAGIIKYRVPVVIGEAHSDTLPVFMMTASQANTSLHLAETSVKDDELQPYIEACERKGDYQAKNIRTALAAVKLLNEEGISTDLEAFKEALKNITSLTGLIGRWQIISEKPTTIIDTGHNPAGWQYLSAQLKRTIEQKRGEWIEAKEAGPSPQLRIVFGMVDDKDLYAVLSLLPKNARYYFTQADSHRAIPAKKLQHIAYGYDLRGNAYPNAQDAYEAANAEASENDSLFIGGSNYIIPRIND